MCGEIDGFLFWDYYFNYYTGMAVLTYKWKSKKNSLFFNVDSAKYDSWFARCWNRLYVICG